MATAPTITIQAEVGEDRQLAITLPPDVPIGPVELIIRPLVEEPVFDLEEAEAELMAAGILTTGPFAPPDAVPLSDDELEALRRKFAGGRLIDEMLDEDRGEY